MIEYHCPSCGSPDHLDVTITVFARIVQTETIFSTDVEGQDHEWDDSSTVHCECGWYGQMFDTLAKECEASQHGDAMVCPCGNVWDMNDPNPPECKGRNNGR